jgi:hypothetical protein
MNEVVPKAKQVALAVIATYPEAERAVLLNWAQQVLLIRGSTLGRVHKVKQIARVTHELGLTKHFLSLGIQETKAMAWGRRSKAMRGVIAGAGVGLAASVAGPMAGVAAFGSAVAVPVVLLGAGAGALLVAIVEELNQDR